MAKIIQTYTIARFVRDPQPIPMPRRARVTGMHLTRNHVHVCAEVLHDTDTDAMDTKRHTRAFVIVESTQAVPEGAGLVAFCDGTHLYEVKPA